MKNKEIQSQSGSLVKTSSLVQKHISQAINSGDFTAYQIGIMHDWLRTLVLMATLLVPIFFFLDMTMTPQAFWPRFGIYRAISTALGILQLIIVLRTLPSKWSYLHGYFISLQVGGIIALMTSDLGGFSSSYYAGLNLVVIGVNLLMPWRALHTAANSFLIMLMYLGFNALWGSHFELSSFFNNFFFMAGTMILAASINYVRFRLIKNEFSLLVDLGKTRDALIDQMKIVEDRTRSIKSLLDVSGQGFLSFDEQFRVSPEYSNECKKFFGAKIEGQLIHELLFPPGKPQEEFKSGLELFFTGTSKPEVIFDLLDHSLTINNYIVQLEYKAVHPYRVMLVLTDITEERRLQEESRRENEKWSRLLKVIANRQSFSIFIRDAQALFSALENPVEGYKGIVRDMHSLKANAGFLGFVKTQAEAHSFEDFLADRIAIGEPIHPADPYRSLHEAFTEEMETVSEALGREWHLSPEMIEIPKADYVRIERHIKQLCPNPEIIEVLESHRKKPLREMLNRFPPVLEDLAVRLGKRVSPLLIQGDSVAVIAEDYEELISSFLHIIRNIIDHGIESPGERIAMDKPPAGTVKIEIQESPEDIVFNFSDDGRGIQLDEIAQRAKNMGLLKADEIADPSSLISMIFRDDFSTSKTINEISGRGVGLPVVREAVQKIGGHIKVKTRQGYGTLMSIIIPKRVIVPKAMAS